MDLNRENKLGISKGTALEDSVTANFRGETQEIGLYLAMARQAQREGYPEIAESLKRIAWEEAEHAARFAELNGQVQKNTRENIEKILSREIGANKGKWESAIKVKEINLDEVHDLFDETSRDEARHARVLQGILNRYFK